MNNNTLGELAELKFLSEATSRGFIVSRPFGHQNRYDFILDTGKKLFKIQVKSTSSSKVDNHGGYLIKTCGSNSYKTKEVDIMACYIFPEDVWYFIPLQRVQNQRSISLYPKIDSKSKYTKYLSNWKIF